MQPWLRGLGIDPERFRRWAAIPEARERYCVVQVCVHVHQLAPQLGLMQGSATMTYPGGELLQFNTSTPAGMGPVAHVSPGHGVFMSWYLATSCPL